MTAVAPRACQTRPARKPVARTIRVLAAGRIVITIGKDSDEYTLTEFPVGGPAFDGRAFRVEKFAGETYGVFLSQSGQDDLCECRGFARWSHCKHRDGLRCLLHRGKLDDTPAVAG
jgi:hypothetical protein